MRINENRYAVFDGEQLMVGGFDVSSTDTGLNVTEKKYNFTV